MRYLIAAVFLAAGCGEVTSPVEDGGGSSAADSELGAPNIDERTCVIDVSLLVVDAGWNAIRSIDDPRFVRADGEEAGDLGDDGRVIGLLVDGEAYAVPHARLFSHEVLNLDSPVPLVVSYCPLTGSSMAFRRDGVDGASMGVSGLLLHNNLVLFDRSEAPSIWSQMGGRSICGVQAGRRLTHWPVMEMRWGAWRTLHPDTWLLAPGARQNSTATGQPTEPSEPWAASAAPTSRSGELVLGVPSPHRDRPVEPGIAFPFEKLRSLPGAHQVVGFTLGGEARVVLWSDDAEGGMAFEPRSAGGAILRLTAPQEAADGGSAPFVDTETGSRFTLDGRAVMGPLVGDRLLPVDDTYVALRVPWLRFHPDSRIWGE